MGIQYAVLLKIRVGFLIVRCECRKTLVADILSSVKEVGRLACVRQKFILLHLWCVCHVLCALYSVLCSYIFCAFNFIGILAHYKYEFLLLLFFSVFHCLSFPIASVNHT